MNKKFNVGISKTDVTYFRDKLGMLGYGRHFHFMNGVETPQYARAYAVKGEKLVVLLVVEFAFSTDYLKQNILRYIAQKSPEMPINNSNLMILAQHTHSTAGGYSQHMAYNLVNPGFQEDVYLHYSEKLSDAVIAAYNNLQPARIFQQTGELDKHAEVCFNRSIAAYNANPEVLEKVEFKNRHLAADRTMKLWRIEQADTAQPLGSVNWFGVHTTSISNRMDKVCSDNKGYAATFMETHLNEIYPQEPVCAFAQDACGDISPNFVWDKKHQEYTGKSEDDYESAQFNGKFQAQLATELFAKAANKGEELKAEVDYLDFYVDMTKVAISEEYTNGKKNQSTSWATFGLAFLEGTTDGQGMPKPLGTVLKGIFAVAHRLEKLAASLRPKNEFSQDMLRLLESQYPKKMFMNHSKGYVIGTDRPHDLIIPDAVDPVIKYIKRMGNKERPIKTPWVPEIVQLQIFIIGQVALIGIPAEITTIAARRLRNTLKPILAQRGVEFIQLCPYANGYAGYITTPEEYQTQHYEGGHTLYGKWTLCAYQQKFAELAQQICLPDEMRAAQGDTPFYLNHEDIWKGFEDETIRVFAR